MTLTQPQRVSLGRLLALLRSDWPDAQVHDAAMVLAGQPTSAFQLCAQAIAQASVAANRDPACIAMPVKHDGPRLPGVRSEPFDPCPAHFGRSRLPDGTYACCRSESDPDPTPFRRTGTHGPPPAVKAKIQEMQRKATR